MSSFRQLMMRNKGGGNTPSYDEIIQLTKSGTPTISNEIASGFNASNYFSFNNSLGVPFEFKIKLKLTSLPQNSTMYAFLGHTGNSGIMSVGVWKYAEGQAKSHIMLSSNSYSWNIAEDVSGNVVLDVGTEYYYKFVFDGTKYCGYVSTDDVTYTLDWSRTSSYYISGGYNFSIVFGKGKSSDWAFTGEIDFNKTRFTKNNVVYKFEAV